MIDLIDIVHRIIVVYSIISSTVSVRRPTHCRLQGMMKTRLAFVRDRVNIHFNKIRKSINYMSESGYHFETKSRIRCGKYKSEGKYQRTKIEQGEKTK